MFYFLEGFDVAKYGEDSTPYFAGENAEFVVQLSTILFEWLNNNYMKVDAGKSHLLLSGNSRATARINNNYIDSEDKQVLLGITAVSNLTFENHINSICKKASQKINALARNTPYINIQKRSWMRYRRTCPKSYANRVIQRGTYLPANLYFFWSKVKNISLRLMFCDIWTKSFLRGLKICLNF